MDLTVPFGLLFLALGVPNLYVGWAGYRERDVPAEFAESALLSLLFTSEWMPSSLRPSRWFEGGIQLVLGLAGAAIGAYLVVRGFSVAFG